MKTPIRKSFKESDAAKAIQDYFGPAGHTEHFLGLIDELIGVVRKEAIRRHDSLIYDTIQAKTDRLRSGDIDLEGSTTQLVNEIIANAYDDIQDLFSDERYLKDDDWVQSVEDAG